MIVLGGTNAPWLTLGWIIALIVLLLTIVFLAIGMVPLLEGLLIGGVAVARLL